MSLDRTRTIDGNLITTTGELAEFMEREKMDSIRMQRAMVIYFRDVDKPDSGPSRQDAFVKALAIIEERAKQPASLKANNYPVDNWRPMAIPEIMSEARTLAAFLLGEDR